MDSSLPQRRPMDTGEIFGEAFRLYSENAVLFLGVLAVLLVPLALLELILPAFSFLSIFVNTFSLAALILVIGARELGKDISIREAYESVGVNTYVNLLITNILAGIAIVIGLVLLIVPGVYLLVRFAFIDPAVVLEKKGITEAFSRSSELVKGSWWRIFGIGLLVFILLVIPEGGLGILLGTAVSPRVSYFAGTVVGMLVQPFAMSALILLYYDVCRRKEGSTSAAV
jgi:Membrane domain of glycerophosphoryl diester phosphodiesterase